MFLAANPYFEYRFQDNPWVKQSFQPAILSVSTVANLGSMAILTRIQASASYPFRINLALCLNVVVFALLTASTRLFLYTTPTGYLVFLLLMVAVTAWAAGLIQNGAFAFAASFGRPEYMQAIMAGQGVAGVLPALVQVASVLSAPSSHVERARDGDEASAAFSYFLTAVLISVVAVVAFVPLARRHNEISEGRLADHMATSMNSFEEAEHAARKVVGPVTLFRKLHWFSVSVFMCFAVTMFFPVFTPKVLSVVPSDDARPILQRAAFVPLGFLLWNVGDLVGRSASLLLPFRGRPFWLFVISIARVVFLPLYALCNIHGQGAVISSDLFYLLLVQFPFGMTNGWLASICMMSAGEYVDESEREASGGFMGLSLVAGLAFGSLLSFSVASV